MKHLSVFLFFIISFTTYGFVDSLQVDSLLKIGIKEVYNNPSKTFEVCNKAMKLSKNNDYLLGKSYNNFGIYYDVIGKYDSALFYYNKALLLSTKSNNVTLKASVLNNLGLIYWNKSSFDFSINYFNKSIDLFEKDKNYEGIGSSLNNIGLIYVEQKRYKKAIEYFVEALAYYNKSDSDYGKSASYSNMGIVYSSLNNYKQADIVIKKSIFLKSKIGDKWGQATNYSNLAINYSKTNQYDSAFMYILRAEYLYIELGNKKNLANTLSSKGKFYINIRQYVSAEKTLYKALEIAKKADSKKSLINIYTHLVLLKRKQGMFLEALNYSEIKSILKADVYNKEKDKIIIESQFKYETAKKDKELALQNVKITQQKLKAKTNEEQMLFGVFIVFFIIVLLGLTLIYQIERKDKIRLKYEFIEQLNIEKATQKIAEDKLRISRELHDNIGARLVFMTSSIENLGDSSEIDSHKLLSMIQFGQETLKELRTTIWAMKNEGSSVTELYFKLLDFSQNVTIPIRVVKECEKEIKLTALEFLNTYRIVQESIQNAVKYANANLINITIVCNGLCLEVSVSDNGGGFDIQNIDTNGIENMKQRSLAINGEFQIESSPNGTVVLTIFRPSLI